MARKGKIEIGASVTVGAKEDGSLSKIEKRIDKLSNEEIEINIKGATKRLQELDKMEQKLGKNMASSIEATRKQLTDLITECKQEQKLRADNLKQIEQEVKAAKELQKIEEKTAKTQKQKTNGPTKREQELADITKSIKGIRGVVNTFDDSKIQKTEEKVRKLIGALDEYQTKLDAMKRLRKGNERTMYDTAKSEIADLKRALGAIQAVKDQTPSIKPKIEKKEKEVEQEKPKKTTTQKSNVPVVGAGDSAKSIQDQTAAIKQQAGAMESLGNAAEKTGEKISAALNRAVKKYNEIMGSIDADSVIGGTGGVTIENIGGLKGMLQKAKRIYDMYYESGTTFSDQRNGTQQEKALWKSETAALRGFLTSYAKYVDDSAEAIYTKIQGKKKEFVKYKLPEYSASESQDDEKYLAFKKEELSIYEKQLVVATELFELQRKYNGAKSYTPNWNKELDKDDDEVRALDFTESAVDNYREMAKLAKTSLDRVVEEIEIKKARLAKQTAQAQEQETASTTRNNNLEYYNQLVQECIQLTGELSDAVAKHARVQREMVNILQSGNIIPQELKDAREQIEEVISSYFKKDFFEPTLSTDGILMWLQSTEAAAISIDRLVDSVEVKYKQMLAAQSELDNTSKINSETTAIQTNTKAVEENIKAKQKASGQKLRGLSEGDKEVLIKLFNDKSFQERQGKEFDPVEELSLRTSMAMFKRLRPRVKDIMNNAVSQLGLEDFNDIVRHYLNDEILANSDTLLFTLFEDYFKQGFKQFSLSDFMKDNNIVPELRNDIVKMLNGLSINYSDFINYAGTLDLETINLRVPDIKQTAQQQERLTSTVKENIAEVEKLQALLSDLKKKYGEGGFEYFADTISSFGTLNASNAIKLYDVLIEKEKEYIAHLEEERQKRAAIVRESQLFMTNSKVQDILFKNQDNEDFIQGAYAGILEKITQGALTANEAVRELEKSLETITVPADIEQQASVTETLAQANNDLVNSYLKVQEAAKKSLDVTDGSTFATILKYYKELLNAPQDNKTIAAQKVLIEKVFNGAKTPSALSALQYADDSELAAMGNKLMLGASFEGEFLFKQVSAYLQDMVGSTIDWGKALAQSNDNVASSAEQAAQQIEQQATANKEVADTSKRVSEQSSAQTQVPNNIINKLTNGVDFAQVLTKYGIPSDKLDSGIDLFKDFAGALYQENGGGVEANEIFNTLFEFISKNAQRTVAVQKSLEAFYDRMKMQQIRIPENMESSFEAENTDKWNNIKRLYAIGGNYKNKQRLITTSKYASTPDVLIENLLEEGFGYALGIDKTFNGSAQDALRLLLDAIQRAKDETKLGKTQKIIGLTEQEQLDLATDLADITNIISKNYSALNVASSEVNVENNGVAGSAEKTAGTLKDQASSAEQAANAMRELQAAEDEKSTFSAEKVETEIDRIRNAIHSSEIGLDQIANTDGLQAAVSAYVKSLDEIDDKKFKLISADINEVAEGVDRVTLKFQSLEDENVKLAQTWAMNDGELTLGRLRTTKTFVDSESNFDTELERTVANSKIDALESQLIGIDHMSQKVTDSLTSLRTAAGNISSDSDIKTFAKNFQVAQNYVREFKNEYKTLGSLANETQNAQAKMANAQETINAQISSSAKYIGVDGYDKVTKSIDNMTSALSKYNEAQKMISDGGLDAEAVGKYEKQMADAFTEYNKAEKQLGAAMKEVRANASFDTFSESMKDAETIIETAKLKLDKFGELDGVDKANGYITDMTAAWKKFNDTDSTIEDKAQAVKDFEAAQKSLAKQMQYLSAEDAWWRKVIDDNPSEPSEDSIKKYAKTLASSFQQINEISSKIYSLELKDDGSGVWSPLISSLEMQKADLLNRVQDIAQQINTTFNDSFVQGDKIEFPFSTLMNGLNDDVGTSGTIESFFNDVRTQTVLTEQSIDKFISTLQNGQNKSEEFAITLAEKLSAASKAAKTLSKLYRSGEVSSDNELYKGGLTKLFAYNQYKSSLPQDPTTWSSEQISTIQKMASELNNYVSELDKAASKEAEYFKSKKQYANVANMQDYDAMASSMDNVSKSSNRAREDLEKFVAGFTGGRGIVTGFTTSVDGISKINFGVLKEGTNQFRTFSTEMGTFTDKVYTYETSMKNMTAGTEAAEKALASMSQTMSRLNGNGFTVDNNDYVKSLYEKMQSLRNALLTTGTSKDAGDQSNLQNLANDANRLIKTLASLENSWLKVNDAVADGNAEMVGTIGKNEDVYKKMVQLADGVAAAMPGSTLSIDGFNQKTKELTYTIEGADGQVKTFVMSMDKLSGSAVASVKSIDKAKTGLQEFLSGIGDTGKQLLQYGLRMVEVYDIIRYLRQGFNEVLQIDTAMTELKKVTDETTVAYDNFAKSAYESSRKIGSTMKEFIQATADFARLGYSIDEASQLAEAANVYKNVGDGIDDVAQASESIISTMKAFNIEATDSMGIVDRFNEIGNNFAIDSVGIGEALQRSASALAEAGNSIDESIALVTAANSVVQNPEQVGTALKTLALRLRGTKTELEDAGLETDGMAESVSQLQAKLKALTHGKVDIMIDANTFKSSTQILREMADAWQYMTDIEKASALELMGGKRQACKIA